MKDASGASVKATVLSQGRHDKVTGLQHLDKVIDIDQSPIGRTPRSNPATYTGLFAPIRDWFSELPESRARGYKPGRFSFNVKGGRCEACQGDGMKLVEMHFLADVLVPCEVCSGKRFNDATLRVQFKGKNIAEVLDLSITEAIEHFRAFLGAAPLDRRRQIEPRRTGSGSCACSNASAALAARAPSRPST